MSRLLIAMLTVLSTAAVALETPLIVTAANSDRVATINPVLGTITQYRVATGQNGPISRFGTGNFLADLTTLENHVVDGPADDVFHALRTGTMNVKPPPYIFIEDVLGKIATPKTAQAAGLVPFNVRARNSEKEFWSKPHPYDGVVRAALGNSYLLVAVPASRTLLLYDMQNENANLVLLAATNIGPYLYHPTTSNSEPTVDGLLSKLPQDVQNERKDAIKKQMEAQLERPEQVIDLKPSDLWVTGTNLDEFVVADLANLKIIALQYRGKDLFVNSIRNMEVDLMVPSAINSPPDIQGLYDNFRRDKTAKAFLDGEEIKDFIDFQVYVDSLQSGGGNAGAAGGAKASPIRVAVRNQDVVFDFTDRRKILAYQFGGDTKVVLKSIRDYTLDAGIDLIAKEIQSRANGVEFLGLAKSQRSPVLAMRLLQSSLRSNPLLYDAVQKDKRLLKTVEGQPGFAELIEEAAKKVKAMDDARAARIKAAEERRKAKDER